MSDAAIELAYDDNGTAHKDVVVRFGAVERICDSYFFALDRGLEADDESPRKVRLVITELLRQWLLDVEMLEIGATAYLPYDLSDQYSAWVLVERQDADCMVLATTWTAALPGWSFDASDYRTVLPGLVALNPPADDGTRTEVRREALAAAIRASMSRVAR